MTFLKVMGFSLVLLLSYTLFANILPQVQSNPPEEEAAIPSGALDAAAMAAWGERLFSGKGTCTLCHNDLGRAPNLLALDLSKTLPARIADPRYTGAAKGMQGAEAIAAYLHESMVEPSAYVVAGFGKKGTNDTVSPMPVVKAAPISLSGTEINALVAFLQQRAGFEVTVPLPTGEAATVAPEAEEEGPAASGEEAVAKYGCSACHDLEGSGADIGPALAGLGAKIGRDRLREAVLNPNASIAEGFEADIMPQDFGEQMTAGELELILDYLMALPKQGASQ